MRLSQRMMLLDEPSQPLLDDMGVELRRRDVGMAKELRHPANMGATLEEMAWKGKTEHVRRDARGLDAGGDRKRFELLAEALAGQVLSSRRRKKPGRLRPSMRLVFLDRGDVRGERVARGVGQWNEALSTTFALDGSA